MKKMPLSMYKPVLALGLACALPALAHAAVVYDEITVKDAGGSVLASVIATPAEIAANPDGLFYVPGIAVDPTEYGNYGIVIDAGGNPINLFGVALGGPDSPDTLNLAFGTGLASVYPFQNQVLGTGAPIDMTQFLDSSLQAAGDTAFFIAENVSGVPEPLTWAMMVVGFAAVGCGMRHKAQLRRPSFAYS